MRKKICMIMTGLHSEVHHRMIEGIYDQSAALGYDVYLYSLYENPSMGALSQRGAENILTLIQPDLFDGFLVRKGGFQDANIRERIDALCRDSGKSYLDLDDPDAPGERYPLWNDRNNFRKITEHLITIHSCRKIYCVTGFQGVHQSENRLAGYRDALLAHGITPNPAYEFYGDFWKPYAEAFADRLASGELPMPDAVVFAGTIPAKTCIERLSHHGIRVPEDIIVAGYDCTIEAVLGTPSITSIFHSSYNQGVNAVCRLYQEITGKTPDAVALREETVQPAESCGCIVQKNESFWWYKENLSEQLEYQEMFRNSGMQLKLSSAENADEFFHRLVHVNYLIRKARKVWCCLCDDWDGINHVEGESYRTQGYSDRILTYMHACDGEITFSISNKNDIPEKIANKERPSVFFFFPLHYEDRTFGFTCIEFQDSRRAPNALFWNWLDLVNNALETIRIRYYISRFSERMQLAAIRDPMTGIYNRRGFEELSAEIYEYAVIHQEHFLLIAVKLFNLSEINEVCGYQDGNQLILTMSEAVNLSCTGNEVCCRVRAGSFYIIGSHSDQHTEKDTHSKRILAYCGKHLEQIEEKCHIKIDIEVHDEAADSAKLLRDVIGQLDARLRQKHRSRQKKITHLGNMADLRRAIYTEPQHKWTVDEMARAMMLSRGYFQRMYKQTFGISAAADVIAARVELAKKLLTGSKMSIREIAEQCGYATDFYFMQQFKKETGVTPLEFRKQNQ